jgi:hypothetical protein
MDEQSGSETTSGNSNTKRLIVVIILVILLIGCLVFGFWAFSKMQDYKNNSDKKSAAAVAEANKKLTSQLETKFAEDNKSPNKTFKGSPTYGSITFNYPKTWSGYIDTSDSSEPINGYFHPDVVPGIESKTAYALRVELVSTDYAEVMQQFSDNIQDGTMTARAYVPPKLQGIANATAGTYLTGKINDQDQTQRGSMVVMKVRDKTLEIYSESDSFANDFNNIVLPSLTFVP